MRQKAYRDVTVAAKYKLFMAMEIVITIQCKPSLADFGCVGLL